MMKVPRWEFHLALEINLKLIWNFFLVCQKDEKDEVNI